MKLNGLTFACCVLGMSLLSSVEAGNVTQSLSENKRQAIRYMADCFKQINRIMAERFEFPKFRNCEDKALIERGLKKPKLVQASELFTGLQTDLPMPQNIYLNVQMKDGKWLSMILERDDEFYGFPYIMDGRVAKP